MTHYDFIIIGTGAGGGTLLHKLAPTGKKILVLERGTFLPREKQNWDAVEVFQKDRYHTDEVWHDHEGKEIHPGTGYWVGGNTKVYGAALLRLRAEDFNGVQHKDGMSPAWCVGYNDFEPYYVEAEKLYHVHGRRGDDPTEPNMSADYPFPPVSHEPRIQGLNDDLKAHGYHPFYLPLGVKLNEKDMFHSACIRCDTCDGFPCLVDAKSDSDINCTRPALQHSNVELLTEAKVTRLVTSESGREVTSVEVERKGEKLSFKGSIVVVACGAINSAALLLLSANDKHPKGLANRSDQVGRNFMKHHNGAILGVSTKPNPTQFQKTLALNDFYWGDDEFKFPMGHIQLLGKLNKDMLAADAPKFAPDFALEKMATHSVAWWLTGEDLPLPENRVVIDKQGNIELHYRDHNIDGFNRLMKKWTEILRDVDDEHVIPHSLYFRKHIPIAAVGHQCGTTRFGTDPSTSVLDEHCKAHDLDNLYVVDGGFFPSSAAVNPSLTIMANALRVGDHLIARV
ncbi:MAG: dehydrogenase [[Candidatus Thermochlorobacteriaceae] bacterium GBChlB]|nr:MAG: dehydrogenase [[Candidatus Thermochlorobacteriaceae] bacterium GBChlB]